MERTKEHRGSRQGLEHTGRSHGYSPGQSIGADRTIVAFDQQTNASFRSLEKKFGSGR